MSTAILDQAGVVIACAACGQKNRLRYDRLGSENRCGKCHATLAAPAEPIEVSDAATFDSLVSSSPLPVVVDFWAPWCGPCRIAGRYLVVKVNTDEVPELGDRFGIRSIPTMAVFKGGREAARTAGARP